MIEIIKAFTDNWFGRFLLGMMAIAIALVIFLPFAVIQENREIEAMLLACEAKNGALLDHTKRVMIGKIITEEHKYVCVDKNLIIEYKTE
jgi:hypothetical protein